MHNYTTNLHSESKHIPVYAIFLGFPYGVPGCTGLYTGFMVEDSLFLLSERERKRHRDISKPRYFLPSHKHTYNTNIQTRFLILTISQGKTALIHLKLWGLLCNYKRFNALFIMKTKILERDIISCCSYLGHKK